jgi:hypothetical protein
MCMCTCLSIIIIPISTTQKHILLSGDNTQLWRAVVTAIHWTRNGGWRGGERKNITTSRFRKSQNCRLCLQGQFISYLNDKTYTSTLWSLASDTVQSCSRIPTIPKNMLPSDSVQAVTLLTCIMGVCGSNLGWHRQSWLRFSVVSLGSSRGMPSSALKSCHDHFLLHSLNSLFTSIQ